MTDFQVLTPPETPSINEPVNTASDNLGGKYDLRCNTLLTSCPFDHRCPAKNISICTPVRVAVESYRCNHQRGPQIQCLPILFVDHFIQRRIRQQLCQLQLVRPCGPIPKSQFQRCGRYASNCKLKVLSAIVCKHSDSLPQHFMIFDDKSFLCDKPKTINISEYCYLIRNHLLT